METKDPALTKTAINSHEALAEMHINNEHHDFDQAHNHAHADSAVEEKGTETLQETVMGADFIDKMENLDNQSVDESMANRRTHEVIAGDNVTHAVPLSEAVIDEELAKRDMIVQNTMHTLNYNDIKDDTTVNKGTDTFKEGVVPSEHVNEGDNAARQPDRRDQQGSSAFDEGINEDSVGSEAPKSEGLTTMNRYASIDNAQTRILNPDEKD